MIVIMLSYTQLSTQVKERMNVGNNKLNKYTISGNYRDMKLPVGVKQNLLESVEKPKETASSVHLMS